MSSEEEEIGILKCRRKNHAEIMNEEVKGSSSEVEEIGIHKFSGKSHVDIINEELKGISNEERDWNT